jgi:hypothetical protein
LAQLNLDFLRVERKDNAIVRSIGSVEAQLQEAKLKNGKLNEFVTIFIILFPQRI